MVKSRKTTSKMNPDERGGFTIIEVVLVLAIAGLIFLMVFIALPALQRAQRDTQRRTQMANLQTAITQYQTNNNGKLPAEGQIESKDEGELDLQNNYPCGSSTSVTNNSASCFIRNYLNSVTAVENEFTDPRGPAYGLTIMKFTGAGDELTLTAADYDEHMVYIIEKAKCGEGESAVYSSNSRDYAIMLKLEGSGTYCKDNAS